MPEAMDLLDGLRLDTGDRWGQLAVGWQRENARAVLSAGRDDPRLFWHELPKGASKSTDAAAMSIVVVGAGASG